jgi:hypothetical protein
VRRVVMGAVVSVLSAGFALAAPSAFAATHFAGNAPGTVTCLVSVTVKYAQPMTNTNAGYVGMMSKVKLKGCHASNPGVKIQPTKFTNAAVFTNDNVLNCGSSGSSSVTSSFTIAWKGKFTGSMGGGSQFRGKANYNPTTVTDDGEQAVTGTGGRAAISMPVNPSSTMAIGSFLALSNGMTGTFTSNYPASQITTLCAGRGITRMTFTGTMTVG